MGIVFSYFRFLLLGLIMYKIYWTIPSDDQPWYKEVPESDVKDTIDSLDRLGFPVLKVEMS
jgi:hypothetical protein